jgi:CBS domain-containing protein
MLSEEEDARHTAFPVVDASGALVGMLTRREVLTLSQRLDARLDDVVRRDHDVIYDDCSLREAADKMLNGGFGRLPVVARSAPKTVIGIVTPSDLLGVHRRRLDGEQLSQPTIQLKRFLPRVARRGRA